MGSASSVQLWTRLFTGILVVTGFVPIFITTWPWTTLRLLIAAKRCVRPCVRRYRKWHRKKNSRQNRVAPSPSPLLHTHAHATAPLLAHVPVPIPVDMPAPVSLPLPLPSQPSLPPRGDIDGNGNGNTGTSNGTGAREAVYISPTTPPLLGRTASLHQHATNNNAHGDNGSSGNGNGNNGNGLNGTVMSMAMVKNVSSMIMPIGQSEHGTAKVSPFIVTSTNMATTNSSDGNHGTLQLIQPLPLPLQSQSPQQSLPQSQPHASQQQQLSVALPHGAHQQSSVAMTTPITVVQSTPIAITRSVYLLPSFLHSYYHDIHLHSHVLYE